MLALTMLCSVTAFSVSTLATMPARRMTSLDSKSGKSEAESEDSLGNLFGKATWIGAEALGNIAANLRGAKPPSVAESVPISTFGVPPASRSEAVDRLKAEYDAAYFISGKLDEALYAEDCEFADPFASFKGRARFKANLENLAGGFITDSDVRLLDLTTDSDHASVTSRCMVRLSLALPWRPVLAWVWGVRHEFGAEKPLENVFVRHIESWEISPLDGVLQVFRAGPEKGLVKRRGATKENIAEEE